MKGKSLLVQILTTIILVIGSYGKLFDATTAAWLGIVSMGLTSILGTFFKSGEFVKGWSKVMIAVNAIGILVQLLNASSENGLLPADVVNYVVIGINIFMGVFLKDYIGNGSIAEKRSV